MALVPYLALTSRRSRTPTNLAKDLSLHSEDVVRVFDTFPGLFRSARTSETGEHFYRLYARFALRDADDHEAMAMVGPELLRSLLDFISQRAAAEAAEVQARRTLQHANRNTVVAAVAAVVAALASIGSAVVG